MSDPTPPKVPAAGDAAAMPQKKTGITLLLLINSVLLAGVLAMLVLRPGHGSTEKEAGAPATADKSEGAEKSAAGGGIGPTVRLADFIIHLRNPETERYARISFEIEMGSEPDKEQMTSHLPRIRETFIAYLSDQTLEDLRGSDGIKKTKEALLQKLNEIAPKSAPRAIYITDLVIQ
jgi:flagellar FliL protein